MAKKMQKEKKNLPPWLKKKGEEDEKPAKGKEKPKAKK